MKHSFKKLVSLVLVLAISFVVAVPTFAKENTNDLKDSGVKDSSTSYISQSDALLLAKQCIIDSIATDDHCTWDNDTTVKSTVPIYDLNDKVGFYLFRLSSGYTFVSASRLNPKVVAYSYDSDFMSDSMIKGAQEKSNAIMSNSDKIVYAGGLDFLKQNNTTYKALDTGVAVNNSDITDMRAKYNNKIGKVSNVKAQETLNNLKVGNVQGQANALRLSTSSDATYTIPHLWDDDYQVYTTSDLAYEGEVFYDNNCAPTAGTNFMYYWGVKANRKNSALWTFPGQVHKDLYGLMKTNQDGDGGTHYEDILPALQQYSADNDVGIISNYNFSATSYSKCVETIKQKGPFVLCLWNDNSPKGYGDHSVLAVGCGNNYLRILDGWDTDRSNFFDSTYLSAVNDNARGVYTTY